LNHAYDAITRYVVLADHSAVAVSLWAAWTYVYDSGTVAPLLAIVSPVRRCGKSRLLTILLYLAARAISASNITPAAIYRVIERYAPLTLLIDEVDTFWEDDELRGIINAGHTKELAFVVRNVPTPDGAYEPQRFSVWCPKALASIGLVHATWHDRAITIRMERKRKDEHVERIDESHLKQVARELFTAVVTDTVKAAVAESDATCPDCPDCLHDRAADNWRPLLAIADAAGGDWPQRARDAAIALGCVEDPDGEERPVRLVRDCLTVFCDEEELTAKELATRLAELDDSPWPTYHYGRAISPEHVGKMLRRFGIVPHKTRFGNVYRRQDLESISQRYSSSQE
jgi:putative DNA primase/helicase